MRRVSLHLLYEFFVTGLVIFSLVADLPDPQGAYLDWFVWGLFVVDYTTRVSVADRKWEFIKKHPLDLIAIIPLDQIFRAARIIRLVRVVRLISILKRERSVFEGVLEKYKIDRIFIFIVALLFLSTIAMKWVEPSFETYADSLWWAIVTTTTVGYGDLYPETLPGRVIASFLMIVGIGTIGVVTGTVASIFTASRKEELPVELEYVKKKIDHYPDLDEKDLDQMITQLETIKEKMK